MHPKRYGNIKFTVDKFPRHFMHLSFIHVDRITDGPIDLYDLFKPKSTNVTRWDAMSCEFYLQAYTVSQPWCLLMLKIFSDIK